MVFRHSLQIDGRNGHGLALELVPAHGLTARSLASSLAGTPEVSSLLARGQVLRGTLTTVARINLGADNGSECNVV